MNFRRCFVLVFCVFLAFCQEAAQSDTETQNRLFEQDAPKILAEIKEMLYQDQSIRRLEQYGTSDTLVIDSIENALVTAGIDLDSLYVNNNTLFTTARFKDSIAQLRNLQDERHTKRLVELISKYGYPSGKRIDSSSNIDPLLILHHPSLKYKDTLLALLTKELKAKRLDTFNYELIKWDLGGRQGLPNVPMDVQHNSDGSTTIKFK